MTAEVCLEIGRKRVFASALDWPGWCRSGKSEEEALDALAEYSARYAPVPARAGIRFGANGVEDFHVIERIAGNATTDFGAPNLPALAEETAVDHAAAERMAALVDAAWEVFDQVVSGAPASLRKGPRGGGRDRDKIAEHVHNAAKAYARKLGITGLGSPDAVREAIFEVLRRPSDGAPVADKRWTTRYAARRIAWHLLDHAWEIEDRSR